MRLTCMGCMSPARVGRYADALSCLKFNCDRDFRRLHTRDRCFADVEVAKGRAVFISEYRDARAFTSRYGRAPSVSPASSSYFPAQNSSLLNGSD